MVRVLVSGSGNMGRAILGALEAADGLEPVGCVDGLAEDGEMALPSGRALPLLRDPARAGQETRPDVVIDFSNAAWTPRLMDATLPLGVRPVIGTTGLSDAWVESLARECAERRIGGLIAANFAIGAVLLMQMARMAAPFFDAAEIIELHHDRKVDAPSGTSIATAKGMIDAREGRAFGRNEPEATPIAHSRDAALGGITIHSVRLPGLVAHQEVLFGGAGQTLTIRHDSLGRDSFLPGILLAAREVMDRDSLVVGLESLVLG